MKTTPILYALGDLTEATKANAWEAVQTAVEAQGCRVNWSLFVTIEAEAFGHLDQEHALWRLLQEPWLGPDPGARRLAGDRKLETFAQQHRDALRRTLEERESFLALACPRLIEQAVAAGFHLQRVLPTEAQIRSFTPEELAHHRACQFPATKLLPLVATGPRRHQHLLGLHPLLVHA